MAVETGEERRVVDETAGGRFRVHRSVFTDPRMFEAEYERIFSRCWVYVGHESEVENPGDFLTRKVIGHPILFIRDADRQVRVLFNTCTHQGSLVCRVPRGRAQALQCFFHGWTFNTRGELIGLPGEDGYAGRFDRAACSLQGPARVASYRGFVFMNLDPHAVGLVDYLGRACEYLDLVADEGEHGMEVVPGTQKYSTHANWKMLVMNSQDGYHVATTHATYFQYLRDQGVDVSKRRLGARHDLGHGHTAADFMGGWGRPVARWNPPFPESLKPEIEATRRRLEERLGAERARRIADEDRNLYIFPNLAILDHSAVTIRNWQPVAPGKIEVSAWCLAPCGESPGLRGSRLTNFLTFWGPAGFSTPDDVEALEAAQRGMGNREVEWTDVSKGALRERDPDAEDNSDELQLRAFWREWRRRMEPSRASGHPGTG